MPIPYLGLGNYKNWVSGTFEAMGTGTGPSNLSKMEYSHSMTSHHGNSPKIPAAAHSCSLLAPKPHPIPLNTFHCIHSLFYHTSHMQPNLWRHALAVWCI